MILLVIAWVICAIILLVLWYLLKRGGGPL